jgi:REP element-mobilizing transposase RayT
MPSSYVSNHIHIVFSTKNRLKIIREELQPKLWAYMAGIAKNHGMDALAIGGIADHAHILLNLGSTLSIAKAVQVLKANSSRWMNEHPGDRFEWQEGYFACSVSQSQVATTRHYIMNQTEHHRRINSTQEFELLLKRHSLKETSPSPRGEQPSPPHDSVGEGFHAAESEGRNNL